MILTIIQARLGSTRLPGKILMPIAGKPMLQHVIDAAPEPRVVAMPAEDKPRITSVAYKSETAKPDNAYVFYYDGDPNDVLGRFYHTWQNYKSEATWILRLTGDCPMLTREIVERFIKNIFWGPEGKTIYRTDVIYTNRPWDPDGYDLELFPSQFLKIAHEQATDPYDREHVTSWMYRHLNVRRFSIFGREPQMEHPEEKVSIDVIEDYIKVKQIMEGK